MMGLEDKTYPSLPANITSESATKFSNRTQLVKDNPTCLLSLCLYLLLSLLYLCLELDITRQDIQVIDTHCFNI